MPVFRKNFELAPGEVLAFTCECLDPSGAAFTLTGYSPKITFYSKSVPVLTRTDIEVNANNLGVWVPSSLLSATGAKAFDYVVSISLDIDPEAEYAVLRGRVVIAP